MQKGKQEKLGATRRNAVLYSARLPQGHIGQMPQLLAGAEGQEDALVNSDWFSLGLKNVD